MPISSRTGPPVNVNVPPMPSHMRILMEQDRVFVFSVNPKSFPRPQGSSGMFTVPARESGERYSQPVSHQGLGISRIIPETVVDTVEGRKVTQKWDFSTDGMQVARDICGLQYSVDQAENLTRYGVFIAAGRVPTEEELRAAETARDNEYRRLVMEADNLYRVNGGMETINGKTSSNISPLHVEALTALRMERPWAQGGSPQVLADCISCGTPVKPDMAFCPNGCMVDEAKARLSKPWLFAEEKRGPGRPRAEAAA